MTEERLLSPPESALSAPSEPVELPLRVVPDWDEQVQRASHLARLIDRHLDYEADSRPALEADRLTPIRLCPEQRVNLLTDVRAITHQARGSR